MKKHLITNEDSLSIAISSIRNYARKNEPFNVLIQPLFEKRTSNQLRYYWVLITIIQDYLNEHRKTTTDIS